MLSCFHCQNPVEEGQTVYAEIHGKQEVFCCHGCKTVALLITNSQKDSFYDLRGSSLLTPAKTDLQYSRQSIDNEFTYQRFVSGSDKKHCEVYLTITNIHCSACVWLNEKVLLEADGIESVRINFANSRAHILWDDEKISLYDILQLIQSIGYHPVLVSPFSENETLNYNARDLFIRMAVAGFCFGNIMLLSTALYAGFFTGIEVEFRKFFHYLSWGFATPVYLYSGIPFLRSAFYGLKHKTLNMDSLLVLGVSLTYFYSVYVTISNRGEIYFESVCMIYFFILLGKYMEAVARKKAGEKIGVLVSNLPETATKITENAQEEVVLASSIQKGDTIQVLPGEKIPVDGVLLTETAEVDESFLTGESVPIYKKKGGRLYAGSIALESYLQMQADDSALNSTLSQLKKLVEHALLEKPGIQKITDRIASYFIWTVLTLAIITFCYWFFVHGNLEQALVNTISVLIVACPCALGLSVPITIVINHSINARNGILIKNPEVIEMLQKPDTILFDKTGTLTEGHFRVVSQTWQDRQMEAMIHFVESHSTHPIATAIRRHFSQISNDHFTMQEFQEIRGQGVMATISNQQQEFHVKIGNAKWLGRTENESEQKTTSVVHLAVNGKYVGNLELEDTLRPEARETIVQLGQNVTSDIRILSGDTQGPVAKVAEKLGIHHYQAQMTPEQKLAEIEAIQAKGKIAIMVGDGMNDSAILARANVGISLRDASSLSIDKSDVILMRNSLSEIGKSITYARFAYRVIHQNIGLSLGYNFIMIPLAMTGYMIPALCALFMTLSSLTVLTNSFLLFKRIRSRR